MCRLVRISHAFTFRIHWSTETATITRTPIARGRHCASTPASHSPLGEHADDQCPDEAPHQSAAPTEQARATDDDSGDAVEVGVRDAVGLAEPARPIWIQAAKP